MKAILVATAVALMAVPAFAAEAPVDEATVMTDQEMDQASGGVGTFAGDTFYTRIINLGSYSLSFNGTTWTRVKN